MASLLAAGVLGAATSVLLVLLAGGTGVAVATTTQTTTTVPGQVTLGSTAGTANANVCTAGTNCTYIPFSTIDSAALVVPFNGTVTSFSVASGSAGGEVELRVLQPAGSGEYTGAGTSPAETVNVGTTTFTVSMPVQAGEVLGVDNSNSALIFASGGSGITAYYESPSLADGTTAAPNHEVEPRQLLMSATVVPATTTTTTTTTPTITGTTTSTLAAPQITGLREARRTWRVGSRQATVARAGIGTVFTFDLSAAARVTVTFTGKVPGRRAGGRCVAPGLAKHGAAACTRVVRPGKLSFAGQSGANALSFEGVIGRHRFPVGRYTARFSASNAGGTAAPATLGFTIVG